MINEIWYPGGDSELIKHIHDVEARSRMQKRMDDLKAVNYHGVRCAMSKDLEMKLERILNAVPAP